MDTVSTGKSETNDLFDQTTNGSAIEIKGSVFTLPVLKICTTDIDQVDKALKTHLAQSLSFFKNAPIVIDLERTKQMQPPMDFTALTALLRDQQLVPVAVQKGSLEQHLEAEKAGLAILTGQSSAKSKKTETGDGAVTDNQPAHGATVDSPAAESASTRVAQPEVPVNAGSGAHTTKLVTQPIRSGQRIYARDGDLIVLAAVNAGAEVMADGNIHIYAPLRGRALAGVKGNENARIFCHSMEAELIAIAGTYRVFEDHVPKEIYQQSVQICLRGEQLDIMPIQ
jgi:septum site-determining protein MinC